MQHWRQFFLKIPKLRFSMDAVKPTTASDIPALDKIRNVAIIAHVDHGKTTLVDCLLKQSGGTSTQDRLMDHNPLERERGITILSKCTSLLRDGHKINIVDTPGTAE